MATLPLPISDPTLEAMNAAIEKAGNAPRPRPYLGMSGIGNACQRAIWYDFRWATARQISARGLRAIQDGYASEDLTAQRLRQVPGIQLWTIGEGGQQIGCEDHAGHFRGHLDGIILGLLQAPKTPHVWENKSVNEKKFNHLKRLIAEIGEKNALHEWDQTYFAQAQLYMHYQGLKRHYLTVNTPGGRDTVACRTEYDPESARQYFSLAREIIASESPPLRLSDDPAYYRCKWCDHQRVCHQRVFPQPTCRSCAQVTPMLDDAGGWHCRKWNDRIPVEVQWEGCDQHLYHPEILHFLKPTNGNLDQNWVQYQDSFGATVINGPPAYGGTSSANLYAAQPRGPVVADASQVNDDVLLSLAQEMACEPAYLLAGDLQESDWNRMAEACVRLSKAWEGQGRRQRVLATLIEQIDQAYMRLAERARLPTEGVG